MSVPSAHFSNAAPASPEVAVLTIAFAFVLVALVVFRRWNRRLAASMDEPRRKVNELFRNTVIPAEEPRFAFDGGTATIVHDQETAGTSADWLQYTLTRYARNPDGEYFMFMFEVVQGTPRLVFSKIVQQHIARYVLGDKYVAPPLVRRG